MIEHLPFGQLLKNVVDNRGKTCPTSESGLPLIATNCILNDRLYPVFAKVRYVDDETYHTWFRGHPLPGDMIFVLKGSPGRVAWVPDPVSFCIAQDMVAIRADEEKIYPKYLFAVLRSKIIQQEIEGLHVGTLIPHFKKGDFDDLHIPVVEPSLQRYIGDQYFDISLKIDLLHRQNKTLEALAQTLFRHWFINGIQDDWDFKTLGDFISVKHGYAFKGKFISTEESEKILVTPGNFKIGGGFKEGKMKYFHGNDFPDGYVFSAGDLVVTMTDLSKGGDTLGYPALIPKNKGRNYLHNQRVGKVLVESAISKYYLYFLMKTPDYRWYILGSSSGTSVRHTSPTSICDYEFSLPPAARIGGFDAIAANVFEKIFSNSTQIRTLEKLRDTLLPKLMSGDVRVLYEKGETV